MSKRGTARKTPVSATAAQFVRPFALRTIKPITTTQKSVWDSYRRNQNLFLRGSAGTGKTFLSLYLALEEVSQADSKYDKVIVVRSVVPTRDIGALPGGIDEKCSIYEMPYHAICADLFEDKKAYQRLKTEEKIDFIPTSFIRGVTIDKAIVIVDEAQNLNFHELDSVITRLGNNTKIVFCGDTKQSDFTKEAERRGYEQFEEIIYRMKSFDIIDFHPEDIVRSGLVKEYLLAS
jgi:phosphate starvation-inducible PhoH-like protein